jgi:hypothetical protein
MLLDDSMSFASASNIRQHLEVPIYPKGKNGLKERKKGGIVNSLRVL